MNEKPLILPKTAAVVLAAGQGTRMKSVTPKVMHALAGRPMVAHVTDVLKKIEVERAVVVIADNMADVAHAVAPAQTVVQADRLGTGHAVSQAKDALSGFKGSV